MSAAAPAEGFQSEGLRDALKDALAGRPAELERLLARNGDVLTPKPNTRLAAAFGVEMASFTGAAAPLLRRLASEDAAPDTDRAFLPIAAAHGWAGRLRAHRDLEEAWAALAELAADERAPVRAGTKDAFLALTARTGAIDELVARATAWLDLDDREIRFGAAAMVAEVLSERRLLSDLRHHEELRQYLSQVIAAIADAPRSSERSDARRRLLAALPSALAAVVADAAGGQEAQRWFAEESAQADHSAVRQVLSDTLIALRGSALGNSAGVIGELRRSLEGSAKPLRDPSRVRIGTGRGKASRRTR